MDDTDTGETGESNELVRVIVELRAPRGDRSAGMDTARSFDVEGFQLDEDYDPVPMEKSDAEMATESEEVVAVRGTVPADKTDELEAQDDVVSVSQDAEVQPFAIQREPGPELEPDYPEFEALSRPPVVDEDAAFDVATESMGTCPITPCDCDGATPKGDIADVRSYLGVDTLWSEGLRGDGVGVGVVDSGIESQSQTDGPLPNVVGGWPTDDWGTVSSWGKHGNMCATDVLGMAPEADLYDIRIATGETGGLLSDALAGYQWAVETYRRTGEPQVLTNSWGFYDKDDAPDYTTKMDHPVTDKVAQAINEGITVLFAAGNCGERCPDGRCASSGPGESIWGANGHPQVVTVGAVNTRDEFVGYSSQGPASLHDRKPDVVSPTHFTGYYRSDGGTSAATPVTAGVVALLEQEAGRSMSPEEIKDALTDTARDFGSGGWDKHSGHGVVRADKALDRVRRFRRRDHVRPRELRITGTQFESTLDPGETQRWFTHSWPSEYVVQWSVRPTTPEGRVDWSVDIKRQEDGNLMYYITIENVGSEETGVEAKYVMTR